MKRRDLICYTAYLAATDGVRAMAQNLKPSFSVLHAVLRVTSRGIAGDSQSPVVGNPLPGAIPGQEDYHGFGMHSLNVDGCNGLLVRPKESLPGRPWVWRTMFWEAFPGTDIVLLEAGFHLALYRRRKYIWLSNGYEALRCLLRHNGPAIWALEIGSIARP